MDDLQFTIGGAIQEKYWVMSLTTDYATGESCAELICDGIVQWTGPACCVVPNDMNTLQ